MNTIRLRITFAALHERGMSLVEVVIAIALIGIVATASLGLYVSSMSAANTQQRQQVAITIANQSMETVLAWSVAKNPTTTVSDLYTGRSETAVRALWTAATGVSGVAQTYPFWDPSATASSVPVIDLTRPVEVGGVKYVAQTLIGKCFQTKDGGNCTAPSSTYPYATPPNSTPLFRVIVIVKWSASSMCGAGGCSYVAQTLIDPNTDLVWNMNG